jgi:hypothetical protein
MDGHPHGKENGAGSLHPELIGCCHPAYIRQREYRLGVWPPREARGYDFFPGDYLKSKSTTEKREKT